MFTERKRTITIVRKCVRMYVNSCACTNVRERTGWKEREREWVREKE